MWFHSPREGSRSHCFSLPHSAVHLVVVATQHHANNVLTDVVHVTLHGGLQSDTALSNSGCNTSEGWTFASSISTCETLFVLPIYIYETINYMYILCISYFITLHTWILFVYILFIYLSGCNLIPIGSHPKSLLGSGPSAPRRCTWAGWDLHQRQWPGCKNRDGGDQGSIVGNPRTTMGSWENCQV